jgi:hypothetical protein
LKQAEELAEGDGVGWADHAEARTLTKIASKIASKPE